MKREREEVESSEKNRPCMTKMMEPSVACWSSVERMPDWVLVQSDLRAEYPETQKEKDDLRLDSWMQTKSTG